MAQQLDVLTYKILRYANDCMSSGVEPSLEEMRTMAAGNAVMFAAAMSECRRKELLTGVYVPEYIDSGQPTVQGNHMAITLDGVEFMKENSRMKEVGGKITDLALSAISNAVQRTITASMGF